MDRMNLLIFSLLLITVSAGQKDKKTTLEDIERDYTTSEKMAKLTPPPSKPTPPRVLTPAQSPTLFGFVPKKTVPDYIQQLQRPSYVQPQYTQRQYVQQLANDYSQYATAEQYTSAPQRYNNGGTQYAIQYSRPQEQYTTQVSSPQSSGYVMQLPNQLQNYENVQYITDNNINGPATPQYLTPQYVYLQPYTSPSTAVQTVVEPKGLQYVMYVPTYVPSNVDEQIQNYENVVYTGNEAPVLTATYQVPQAPQATQHIQPNEQVQYTQPKSRYTKTEYVIKKEPKSLLDSYIPSIVQLQYYNQAQQNSVQEPIKMPQTVSGKEYVKKSYRPEVSSSAETSPTYRYQKSSYKS